MPIVAIQDMLQHAHKNSYAVASFEVKSLEILAGIISAAEQNHSPVILSVKNDKTSDIEFDLFMPAIERAAQNSIVPVAILLEQARSQEVAVKGINTGCNAISMDIKGFTIDENIDVLKKTVQTAHSCGIAVEGCMGDSCDTNQVINYVKETKIDYLKISTVDKQTHQFNESSLDLSILKERLNIPIAIDGRVSLRDTQCYKLIGQGVARISFDTVLFNAIETRIRLNTELNKSGYSQLMNGLMAIVSSEAEACMQLCLSAGQAEAALDYCIPWAPVEHVIIFNVEGISDQQADAMMAEGKKALNTIPGVRKIITARSVKQDAIYRFSWLIRFCHPVVIDSYRDHPVHVDFANRLFRPVAGDRISIDYQWSDALEQCSEMEIATS